MIPSSYDGVVPPVPPGSENASAFDEIVVEENKKESNLERLSNMGSSVVLNRMLQRDSSTKEADPSGMIFRLDKT